MSAMVLLDFVGEANAFAQEHLGRRSLELLLSRVPVEGESVDLHVGEDEIRSFVVRRVVWQVPLKPAAPASVVVVVGPPRPQ